jgi:hypothetical protein
MGIYSGTPSFDWNSPSRPADADGADARHRAAPDTPDGGTMADRFQPFGALASRQGE